MQTTPGFNIAMPRQEIGNMDIPSMSLAINTDRDTTKNTRTKYKPDSGRDVAGKTKKRLAPDLLQTRPLGTVVVPHPIHSISADDFGSDDGHAIVTPDNSPHEVDDVDHKAQLLIEGYDSDNIVVAPIRREHRRRSARLQVQNAIRFSNQGSEDSNKENRAPASAALNMCTPPLSSAIKPRTTSAGKRRPAAVVNDMLEHHQPTAGAHKDDPIEISSAASSSSAYVSDDDDEEVKADVDDSVAPAVLQEEEDDEDEDNNPPRRIANKKRKRRASDTGNDEEYNDPNNVHDNDRPPTSPAIEGLPSIQSTALKRDIKRLGLTIDRQTADLAADLAAEKAMARALQTQTRILHSEVAKQETHLAAQKLRAEVAEGKVQQAEEMAKLKAESGEREAGRRFWRGFVGVIGMGVVAGAVGAKMGFEAGARL